MSRRIFVAIGALVLVGAAACTAGSVSVDPTLPAPSATPTPTPTMPLEASPSVAGDLVTVLEVVDGDTVRVSRDGVSETVRVLALDTPETKDPGAPLECFGLEATAEAERLLPQGTSVRLLQDPSQDTIDRYGRTLAHLVLPDGRLYAEVVIAEGYGIHYIYEGVPSQFAEQLEAAQIQAEAANSGLWAAETCAGDPHSAAATPTPTATPEGTPGNEVYYENCAAVRAAGADPIHIGDPGYGSHLDRDGDGIACE